ncbi:MAG: ATP-binding protein [Saprospiraceae bacterium]
MTGPESSGKTTLASQLSFSSQLPLVEEYARTFLSLGNVIDSARDLILLAQRQIELENQAMHMGTDIICDTDMIVLNIWSQDKFGFVPQALTALTNHHRYTHTFVCTPDIPWAPDPLRVNPFDRERLFQEYIKMLKLIGSPFTIIEGDGPARTAIGMQILAHIRD